VWVTTAWNLRDGILTIKSTASSDPAKIPVGVELKDRIVSISEESFTFERYDGYGQTNGKRETRVRKKESTQAPEPTAPSGRGSS